MPTINGRILTEEGFVQGSIEFDQESILDISRQKSKNPFAKGIVIPLFVNAHTHIGDSFIKGGLNGGIDEIVGPPDGLKHRLLREADDDVILSGMKASLETMMRSGISHFVDFREGGLKGISLLFMACLDYPLTPIAYGRPKNMNYERAEIEALLRVADGIGISSILDWDRTQLKKLRSHVKSSGIGFAFHASERVREDIDEVLDYEPDFLIHMLEATRSDLERCADADVPIVICPRSNFHFGKAPNLKVMTESGVELMLGTDNAMLSTPSILDEMHFLRQMSKGKGILSSGSVLKIAINSRKVLKGQPVLALDIGQPPEFLVLDWDGGNPEEFIVERASEKDILVLVRGERLWTRTSGALTEVSEW